MSSAIELLWGVAARGARGPRPRFAVGEIVTVAIALADAEGLDAVSMRRVAERLGAGTMSLYRYVPGKAELFELMVDRVCGEAAAVVAGEGWRSRLEAVARSNRALYWRHPWLLRVPVARPPLGPGVIAKYDRELRAIDGIGLSDVEMDAVLSVVLGYVAGAVASALDTARARAVQSDDEWWQSVAPRLDRVLDPAAYPLAVRVGTAAGGYDPDRTFEFGLARLLDGIEAYVTTRGGA